MRNLTDVIDQLLKVSTNDALNSKLEKIKEDCFWTAPELMSMRWDLVSQALEIHVPIPLLSDEQVKIISIFTTFSEDEVREGFMEGR